MSVRAYRVNEVIRQESESFNIWHDDELIDFLGHELSNQMNEDGAGMVYIAVDTLEKALKEVKLHVYMKKALKEDIAWAKANDVDFVRYDCF